MDAGMLLKALEKVKAWVTPLILLGYLALLLLLLAGVAHHSYFTQRAPDQPIEFNHGLHVTELGLECAYCHNYAAESRSAGIPPMSLCMECHESAGEDNPEVQKFVGYWERQEPVPWVKIHDLPDYVQFPHKRHIKAGVDCQTDCHGPIALQAKVTKTAPLMMGWCLECHRGQTFEGPDGKIRSGPEDCWACHI